MPASAQAREQHSNIMFINNFMNATPCRLKSQKTAGVRFSDR